MIDVPLTKTKTLAPPYPMQRFSYWLFTLLLLVTPPSHSETADWQTEVSREAANLERLHSLIVVHEGQEVLALDLKSAGLDTPTNIKSLSKTVLAALVGIGIEKVCSREPVNRLLKRSVTAYPPPPPRA